MQQRHGAAPHFAHALFLPSFCPASPRASLCSQLITERHSHSTSRLHHLPQGYGGGGGEEITFKGLRGQENTPEK